MKNIFKKLKNQNGESIGETLVALLISVLAITMLAMMIQTSTNLIRKGDQQFASFIENENKIVEKKADPSTSTGQVYISSKADTSKIYLIDNDTTVVGGKYEVNYFENEVNDIDIISYKAK